MDQEEYPLKQDSTLNNNIPIAQLIQVLEALKQASHNIQNHHNHFSDSDYSPSIKALFQLQTILSTNSILSQHLNHLKTLVDSLHDSKPSLKSFLTRPLAIHSISKVAAAIESELQSWIDYETITAISRLVSTINNDNENENELLPLLTRFSHRVSQGFNRELQQLVLNFKLFSSLESLLYDDKSSHCIREHAGNAIAALIRFNKDVFVGKLCMFPTVRALIDIASVRSIEVLCSLIRSIRSPIVDEIESNGEIPKITALLSSHETQLTVLAMECVLEIGYYGRKEAVEGMLKEGVVEKLVELQRLEVDNGRNGDFAICVKRFAVQLEVGEGLRQREKKEFKGEILVRVRKACVSDAEIATIVAEVLWGSSP